MVEKDCDGDEANIFVPQSYKAKANVIASMMPQNCIVSEQTHKMMVGVVQDALMGAYFLTTPRVYVSEEIFTSIATYTFKYFERSFPSKYKPVDLSSWILDVMKRSEEMGNVKYSGRTLFSIVFPSDFYFLFYDKDDKIEIKNGILISGQVNAGILYKSHNSIIQTYTKRYGSYLAAELISNITRLCQYYLSQRGFSMGISDCIVSDEKQEQLVKKTEEILQKAKEISEIVAPDPILAAIKEQRILSTLNETQKVEQANIIFKPGVSHVVKPNEKVSLIYISSVKEFTNSDKTSQLEIHMKKNKVILFGDKSKTFTLDGLVSIVVGTKHLIMDSFENAFASALSASAKGEALQVAQIYGALGQAMFQGQRIPKTMTNNTRVLPFFPQNSQDPLATGFSLNSYISGMNPVELYLNFIQAREPQTDTTIKTARTGYVQRKLVKYMQDLVIQKDQSVKTDKKRLIQYQYGIFGASVDKMVEVDGESQFSNVVQRVREVTQIENVKNAYVFFLNDVEDWETAATCAYQFYRKRIDYNVSWIQNLNEEKRVSLEKFKKKLEKGFNIEIDEKELQELKKFEPDNDFLDNNIAVVYTFKEFYKILKMEQVKELYFDLKLRKQLSNNFILNVLSYVVKDLILFVPMETPQDIVNKLNIMFDHVIVGGVRNDVNELPYSRIIVFDNYDFVMKGSDEFLFTISSGTVNKDKNGDIEPFEVIVDNKPKPEKEIQVKFNPYTSNKLPQNEKRWNNFNKFMKTLIENKVY